MAVRSSSAASSSPAYGCRVGIPIESQASQPQGEGQGDEALLRTVVQVPLKTAPRRVGRVDDAGA